MNYEHRSLMDMFKIIYVYRNPLYDFDFLPRSSNISTSKLFLYQENLLLLFSTLH
jgi:hypothetical protein